MKVSVITPTTGNPFLKECIESVRAQTYADVQHLIVIDGRERWEEAEKVFIECNFPDPKKDEHVIALPYSIGKDRYNGHRIYGACTYIAEGDYHIWLDDDNALEPNHIDSLVRLVFEKDLAWAYSLRKIIDKDSNVLCEDNCESLGMWASCLHDQDYFVDVNCYFVRKDIATGLSPVWYRKFREPGQMEIDRAIATVLMNERNKLKFDCTRDYTVKYRVGNTGLSVQASFFENGNKKMLEKYNGVLPWKNNN
jgi:glycosyltransferase involved in cell wall biosynthesis